MGQAEPFDGRATGLARVRQTSVFATGPNSGESSYANPTVHLSDSGVRIPFIATRPQTFDWASGWSMIASGKYRAAE